MIPLILSIALALISSGLTFLYLKSYYKHKISKIQICPFNNACTVYHQHHTTEAANRVVQLLIQNIQEENNYKKALRQFITQTSNDS